jgi:carboxyl-terminal processing protease
MTAPRAARLAGAACAVELSRSAARPEAARPPARTRLQRRLRALAARLDELHPPPGAATASPPSAAAAAAAPGRRLEAAARDALRAAAALLAALCLHLAAAPAPALATLAEDGALEAVRQAAARLGGALAAARRALPRAPGAAADAAAAAAAALVAEVWEVVDANFADARGGGFDAPRWAAARAAALAPPPADAPAARAAVRSMLAVLRDPYSRYVPPGEFRAMLRYDVSGVGLNLGTAEELRAKTGLGPGGTGGGVWVVGVVRGSAADAAGARQGDELLAVDGAPLAGRSPFEAASLLAGAAPAEAEVGDLIAAAAAAAAAPAPARVSVRHLDAAAGAEAELAVARPPPAAARPSPVTFRLGGGRGGAPRDGVVRLASFDARAQRDVAAAVRALEAAGAERLVLDLRGNRGGLVSEAVEVASLFLEPGTVVVRAEGRGAARAPPRARAPPLTRLPLAVLVDGRTASAAEIAAGALRDACRAPLAGPRTYGKGLIQSVYELSDGSGLVLTVGSYRTPAGEDIDGVGLAPEFRALPGRAAADAALAACRARAPAAAPAAPAEAAHQPLDF